VLTAPCPLFCVFSSSSLVIVQFLFHFVLQGGGCPSVQGAMLAYPRVTVWISCEAWWSLVGLPGISQASMELASGSWEPACSLCNVVWRSFVWAVG
jgi:hypothetical protein